MGEVKVKEVDYEIRTPDKKILLFTKEKDEKGNTVLVARKGKTIERLTYKDLAFIMYKALS